MPSPPPTHPNHNQTRIHTRQDRANGVVAFERVMEGDARIVAVINAGRKSWQGEDSPYGVWVGQLDGRLQEVLCSQVRLYVLARVILGACGRSVSPVL